MEVQRTKVPGAPVRVTVEARTVQYNVRGPHVPIVIVVLDTTELLEGKYSYDSIDGGEPILPEGGYSTGAD